MFPLSLALLLTTTNALPTLPTLNTTLLPRDSKAFTMSDLTITMYDQPSCQGSEWPLLVQYGINNHYGVKSFTLSRGLRGEQLDFSAWNAQYSKGAGGVDAQCAVWQRSVRAADHANGCFDAKDSACFRLWAY